MKLQEHLKNIVTAHRKESFDKSDQLTLGEIISKCEAILAKGTDDEPVVTLDFGYFYPTKIDSWRGAYEELALNYTTEGVQLTLSIFIDMLKNAIGKGFEGYKGGEFLMSRHTPVWVANYSEGCNSAVIEIVDGDYQVIIMTGYREY